MLQGSSDTVSNDNDGGPQFAEVFVIYWLGASVVTLNIKLLGGSMYVYSVCTLQVYIVSFFLLQEICVTVCDYGDVTRWFATETYSHWWRQQGHLAKSAAVLRKKLPCYRWSCRSHQITLKGFSLLDMTWAQTALIQFFGTVCWVMGWASGL